MGSLFGGSPSHTTTTSITKPPEYIQPYAEGLANRALELSNKPYVHYGQRRIAGLEDEHKDAMAMTAERAMAGSPYMNAAQAYGQDILTNGAQNPYLDAAVANAQEDVVSQYQNVISPQLDMLDRRSGAFGNSGVNEMRTQSMDDFQENLANISENMRYQGYGDAETNKMRAMMLAPQIAESDYRDSQALLGVGDIKRDDKQGYLNQNYGDWEARQQWPYQQLDVLANAVRTSMGGGGSNVTSSPNAQQASRTANMLGTGMMGYGMAQDQGLSNPWAYGLGGGLLGGLF